MRRCSSRGLRRGALFFATEKSQACFRPPPSSAQDISSPEQRKAAAEAARSEEKECEYQERSLIRGKESRGCARVSRRKRERERDLRRRIMFIVVESTCVWEYGYIQRDGYEVEGWVSKRAKNISRSRLNKKPFARYINRLSQDIYRYSADKKQCPKFAHLCRHSVSASPRLTICTYIYIRDGNFSPILHTGGLSDCFANSPLSRANRRKKRPCAFLSPYLYTRTQLNQQLLRCTAPRYARKRTTHIKRGGFAEGRARGKLPTRDRRL